MSSRYQSSATTTSRNYSTNNYNTNSDNRLDELLEDLQSTVSTRPQLNGGTPTKTGSGYREVIKSVKTETMGKPVETSKEYQIEYLNPSNSTTVVQERSSSPYLFNTNSTSNNNLYNSLNKDSNMSSYKTVSYEFNKSRSGRSEVVPSYEKDSGTSQVKFRQNINELDSLLDDLNHSQKTTFPSSSLNSQLRTINTFPEPLDTSTPQKKAHVERIEERSYEEQRYGSLNPSPIKTSEVRREVFTSGDPIVTSPTNTSTSSSEFKKDLVFTGGRSSSPRLREPAYPPAARQVQQEMYQYEAKTTSTNKGSEIPLPVIQKSSLRNYNYETDTIDNAISYNRSPSPGRALQQNYNNTSYIREATSSTRRSPSPPIRSYYAPSTPTMATKTLYSASKTTQESTKSSNLPYRSPSPVSFAVPPESPEPAIKTYTNSYERSIQKQRTPQMSQKFSPSDPTNREIPGGHTVITKNYKYSSQQHTSERYPPYENGYPETTTPVRPFPSPSPTRQIGEQKPPKQLDELMASFSDTQMMRETNRYHTNHVSRSPVTKSPPVTDIETTLIPTAIEKIPEKQKISEVHKEKEKSNGVAGPAVYYPPGPLFEKKEESSVMMEQQNGKGKMEAKRKAKYEYKSGSKMKESSGTKKTIVPICLPLCCGLPCVIM